MKTVLVDKSDCEILFQVFKESQVDREFHLANGLISYFDTALGRMELVEFPTLLFLDKRELSRIIESLDENEAQALADMGKLPPPFIDWYVASTPPRFVEVPCLDWETERELKDEAREKSDVGQGPRWIVMEELKNERVPDQIVDWILEIGRERGIRYQFQIGHLGY